MAIRFPTHLTINENRAHDNVHRHAFDGTLTNAWSFRSLPHQNSPFSLFCFLRRKVWRFTQAATTATEAVRSPQSLNHAKIHFHDQQQETREQSSGKKDRCQDDIPTYCTICHLSLKFSTAVENQRNQQSTKYNIRKYWFPSWTEITAKHRPKNLSFLDNCRDQRLPLFITLQTDP